MRISLLIIISIAFVCRLPAQDSLHGSLDPVTVTANLSPTQSSKTGRNLQVIKGEQFYQLPVNSVDELLRFIPGVEVQARGPMGSQSDILIRGGTFQQVLVILDGVRLNDPLTGHFSTYIPIAPAEIERIEVLKGAASAIYGTEAVGGVVHIITKSFAANAKKSEGQVQATVGEYGLWNLSGGGTYASANTIIGGGIQTNHSTGQPQRGTTGFFDNTTVSASVHHRLSSKWNLGARLAYDDRDFSAQNYYTTFASDTATERVKTVWSQVHAGFNGTLLKWRLEAGYKTTDDRYAFNKASSPNQNNSSVFQLLSTATLPIGKSSLTAGLQHIQKDIESNDRGNHQVWQSAFFFLLNLPLGEYWNIDPAMRLDYHEQGGFEWVPQLNASFKKDNFQLRGSIGRTIRDADFTERFNNYNRALVTSGRVGNPNLEAERSLSYELGADYWVGNQLKISSGWFGRQQEKLIDWVVTPYAQMPRQVNLSPNGTYALASNISEVNTRGFETDVQWMKQWHPKSKITASLGLVWVKSTTPAGTDPGFYLNAHARFLTNFSLQYQWKNLVLSANGIYKERSEQKSVAINASLSPSYLVVNLRLQASVWKKLALYVQTDNIGDTQYSDLLGSPMPGRWFMGGVQWRMGGQ